MSDESTIPIRNINLQRLPLILTLQMNQSFSTILENAVLENTFVDDCKYMIKMINNRYKKWQINFDVNT